ncbi:MAG: dNTP triphosphohydrolase [Planctomycetes bacterium]|nr:dNTP triphosphohydrolase [Planctomycetota bacterium]MBU1517576.1 dNTP triphosphohydrolase [Planctomycetota bacterium]MBU2457030.1 dNTP triphosphohydrolase [Planctomycetota bacterium]MBU2597411.1 dNTP triphosphohydrolase [Planctomycetota bacterium]
MADFLQSYAVSESNSRGRKCPEPGHAYRMPFERDRDRIIHTSAFRRLEGKTQVFIPQTNDQYRTRLTHSIEVAQIGRTIAKSLSVNEALTEAVCLAHDLGHSPFGHSGETALNEIMKNFGGFEHNGQTLRIVDLLERPYPDFAGLNLMYETRLALAKHKTAYDSPQKRSFTEKNCSLEGQIADLADRIAYNCHDLEDGLRANLLNYKMIMDVRLCAQAAERCQADEISDSIIRNTRIAKTIIDMLVGDCIETSRSAIITAGLENLQQVLNDDRNFITLSDDAEQGLGELEKFLHKNMYENPKVKAVSGQAAGWLEKIFNKFRNNPKLMPRFYQNLAGEFGLERTVCDYISGMTDWYCLEIIKD